jgi:Ner family transcriptional regulator
MNRKTDTLTDILRDPQKRRAWVIWQLSLKGRNLTDIARTMGVTRSSVYRAFVTPYPKMERAIADELGMCVAHLFPDRYTDGIPNRVIGRPKKSVINASQNSANGLGRKAKKGGEKRA